METLAASVGVNSAAAGLQVFLNNRLDLARMTKMDVGTAEGVLFWLPLAAVGACSARALRSHTIT